MPQPSKPTLHRASSVLLTKEINPQQRILYGRASSPESDRLGDQLMPRGARFSLPLPFLHQHRHDAPVGRVVDAG